MLIHKSVFVTSCTPLKIKLTTPVVNSQLGNGQNPQFPKMGDAMNHLEGKKKNYREVMVVGSLVARSCPPLCNPMNCSPPGSSVHGISKPRIMECLLFPSPEDLPDPGIKPIYLYWQVDSLPLSNLESPTWTRESSY